MTHSDVVFALHPACRDAMPAWQWRRGIDGGSDCRYIPHSIADQAACTTSRHYVPWNEPCKRELAVDYTDAVPLSRQASRRRPFWLLGPGAGETVDCVVCGGAVGGGRYAVRIEQGNIKRRPLRPPRQHLTPVRRIWAKRPPRSDSRGGRDEVLFEGEL